MENRFMCSSSHQQERNGCGYTWYVFLSLENLLLQAYLILVILWLNGLANEILRAVDKTIFHVLASALES